jgi:hypothetical protein
MSEITTFTPKKRSAVMVLFQKNITEQQSNDMLSKSFFYNQANLILTFPKPIFIFSCFLGNVFIFFPIIFFPLFYCDNLLKVLKLRIFKIKGEKNKPIKNLLICKEDPFDSPSY